jgi:ABC-type transport system substrate-binding protein
MRSTTRRSPFFWVFALILSLPGVAAAAPEGTVVIGLSSLGAEDWLVPARPQANAIAIIPVFNTLLERDDKTGQPAPGLALKWEQSKDGKDLELRSAQGREIPRRKRLHRRGRQVQL